MIRRDDENPPPKPPKPKVIEKPCGLELDLDGALDDLPDAPEPGKPGETR